jgi:hypothetical protein
MDSSHFILSPGRWIGKGVMHLTHTEEDIPFELIWTVAILDLESGLIECVQELILEDAKDHLTNEFIFTEPEEDKFEVEMDNDALGQVEGTGFIDREFLGWEFRNTGGGVEGFESYTRLTGGDYSLKAEFGSSTDIKTTLVGNLYREDTRS